MKYLGLQGRYAAGYIRHRCWKVGVVIIDTLPSSNVAYTDWQSHEYVASVITPLDSRGTHCHRHKKEMTTSYKLKLNILQTLEEAAIDS